MNDTSIALAIFLFYWVIVSVLDKRGTLEKYNISTYGPVLMIRTQRGQDLLNTLARPKRFWRLFANIGIPLMFVGMAAMFLILILSDIALISSFGNNMMPEPGKFNEPRNLLLIPGVNEFIPFTWGLIALIVTLVVHEFSHAILCRVEDIRVKSMGLLVAIVPIGGFAEPDEEELFGVSKEENEYGEIRTVIDPDKVATRNQRARILAAGVMSNFVVAFIAFLLFFGPVLGAIEPLSDTMVVNVTSGSPAFNAGLREGMVITQIDDRSIQSARDIILYTSTVEPNSIVKVHAAKDMVTSVYDIKTVENVEEDITGIYAKGVVKGSPAEDAGFEEGMHMVKIDNTSMHSAEDFIFFMNSTRPGQTIHVEVLPVNQTLEQGSTIGYDVELAPYPNGGNEKGFLGIYYGSDGVKSTPLGISVGEFPANTYLQMLKSIPSMLDGVTGWIIIFGLPIIGFAGEGFPGFSGTLAQFYQPVGWGEPLGIGLFWIANTLLWVGWLNFYVGLFNCLPAVPLDGGHVFRDYMQSFILRITGDETKAQRLSGAIAGTFSLVVLASFLLMIFGPYIVHGF
ncbi:MAG TPA: PDZ domain-containing protein [Methanosarcinaceae archaeon]|nr:PDZ domain-containing protein [Methanosarcinaceae archaeon]